MEFEKSKKIYHWIIFIVLFTGAKSASAQYFLSGPTSVYEGGYEYYNITNSNGQPPPDSYITWSSTVGVLEGGDGYGQSSMALSFYSVESGEISASWYDDFTQQNYYVSIHVEVTQWFPETPSAPTVLTSDCNNTTLQRDAPPTGVTWYWQSNSLGTSTSDANTTKTVANGTTSYLRARNDNTLVWSNSSSSISIIGNSAPIVGTITQPSVTTPTGSVVLSGLPSSGSWVINPGNITGTGTTTTLTGLAESTTYNFTVTNSLGCTSNFSTNVVINESPSILDTPTLSAVTQSNSATSTGNFTITNYNSSYSYTASPSAGVIFSGATVTAPPGSYTITATYGEKSSSPSASVSVNAQSIICGGISNENYIHNIIPQIETTDVSSLSNNEKQEYITYFDGLGRPMQKIDIRASGSVNKDIITHIAYDIFDRQAKEYLPYTDDAGCGMFRTGDIDALTKSFYNTVKYEYTTNPYSQKQFEASPINRVLKQAAPGDDWKLGNGHEIKLDYQTNTGSEVKNFKVNLALSNNTYYPTLTLSTVNEGFYNSNELFKTVTYDENWEPGDDNDHTTEEFKDKEGRVVLKRTYNNSVEHDTYYVYDRFGNLTYVIPPKVNTADGVSAIELSELCYQYRYDHRNRLIEKKIPGKGTGTDWEEIVYNKLDQPILTRDPNLKSLGKALFTKYDAFGRVTYTGFMNVAGTTTRSSLQNTADGYSIQIETKNTSPTTYAGTPVYYSKNAYPVSFDEVHTINYYDNYTFDLAGLTIPTGEVYEQDIATDVKELATGSKVRVLGTNHWITTIMVYDKKGRVIYVASKNEYLNTTDIVQSQYDFVGKVVKTRARHQKGTDNEIVTLDAFEYDHMGRLKNQYQCIGDDSMPDTCGESSAGENLTFSSTVSSTQDEVASNSITLNPGFHVIATSSLSFSAKIEAGGEMIAYNVYDELGQLTAKRVGNTFNSSLQIVNYSYNIRGWLKDINNLSFLGNDLFAFKITYGEHYNGNISGTLWKTKNVDQSQRGYQYIYDDLNRLKATGGLMMTYNVTSINYDKNGNLLRLQRHGHTNDQATQFGTMDNLHYFYDSGNKLMSVTDTGNKTFGFKDGANTTTEYTYDANGNMVSDANKGITGITYNHLNLPTQVTFASGNIQYVYSADGTKLKKAVSTGTETLYAGNYIYEGTTGNAQLQFFNHPEGYVTPDGSGGYDYVYNYVDHLGNVRLSYTDTNGDGSVSTSEIVKESNYYPFGLEHRGYNNGVSSLGNAVAKKYMFGGKEYQDDNVGGTQLNWYDVTARNYDPALGRWMNVDPKAELYYNYSSYVYSLNSPIIFNDPDGEKVVWAHQGDNENSEETRKRRMEIGSLIHQMRKESEVFNAFFEKLHAAENEYAIEFTESESDIGIDAVVVPNSDFEIVGSDSNFVPILKPGKSGASLSIYFGQLKKDNLQLKDVLAEEFVHLYQQQHYVGDNSFDYNKKPDGVNIEYEAKAITGWIKNQAGIKLNKNGTGWAELKGIKYFNSPKTFRNYSKDAKEWLNLPDIQKTWYAKKIFNTNQAPTLLIKLINSK